ncbi:MAG: anaerobic ribonucleoside-triphosphate reductase activating protein [Clostridiaceae bacterium]|jgi:pyruvate formate lyase activating enzyme|nr:anaerobic ribonucleoside-triphosphate reductase activating protein [Clostridiaceae bacterium]
MKISGLQKSSMIDYPGNISAVVFTQGCNMNCGYCHNRCLIGATSKNETILQDDIIAFLKTRRGLLDGVVISGGEPTLQKDIPQFLDIIKGMGFKTKLDTNGTNPECLKILLENKLLDYVAMDIKAPLCKYRKVCCSPVDTRKISESISILKEDQVEYEFRTTYTPELCDEDLMDISETIKGAHKYVLQQYREVESSEGKYTGYVEKRNILKSIRSELMKRVDALQFRGDFGFV